MLLEDDFRSEWQAIEDAVQLRSEVCCISLDVPHSSLVIADPSNVHARPHPAERVHFHDYAHVFVGDAHELKMDSFPVPVAQLSAWLQECDLGCSLVEEPLCEVSSPTLYTREPPVRNLTFSTSTSPFEFVVLNVPDETTLDDEVDVPPEDCHASHVVDSPTWHSTQQAPHATPHQWIPNPATLPEWWAELRRLHDVAAVTENLDEGPILYLMTWFLHGDYQPQCREPRILRLDHFWHHWLADVRELWHDRIDATVPASIGLVFPEPPIATGRFHQGHLIVHQRTGDEPVNIFTAVFHGSRDDFIQQLASIAPQRVHCRDVIALLQVGLQCDQPDRRCDLQLPNVRLPIDAPAVPIRSYESVNLHIDHPDYEVHDEVTFLAAGAHARAPPAPRAIVNMPNVAVQPDDPMQAADPDDVAAASSDSDEETASEDKDWYPVTVFGLHRAIGEGQACWRNHNAYRYNVARIMRLRDDDILQIFHVPWPPANLRAAGRQALIIQQRDELPEGSNHKYVLIDVEFHPHRPSVMVEFVRAVYLVPEAFTRSNLLDFMGLTSFCNLNHNRCLVWRNQQLIGLQDLSQIRPLHGDFFRIVVPPPPDNMQCVPTRVAARIAQSGVPGQQIQRYYLENEVRDIHEMPAAFDILDVMDLMQRPTSPRFADADVFWSPPSPLLCHRDSAADERRVDSSTFDRMPAQHEALPGQPFVPFDTGFEHELAQRWAQFARPGPGGVEHCLTIRTWYNDHERWPICGQPRDVCLFNDNHHWRHEILRVWNDLADPHLAADIVIVEPDPTDDDPHLAGHAIVIQRPLADAKSILVSVLDNAIWNGAPRRWAIRSSADPTGHEIVALMGYRLLCPPHVPTTICQLWCRRRELPLHDRLLVRHGLALTVTILRAFEEDVDATAFLQLPSEQPRQRIDLPSVIEMPIFTDLDFRDVVALRDSLTELDLGKTGGRASVVKWHDATRAAFDTTPDWNGEEPLGFAFFSDGSSAILEQDRLATAAVTLIVHTRLGQRFGGFRCFALEPSAFAPQAEPTA